MGCCCYYQAYNIPRDPSTCRIDVDNVTIRYSHIRDYLREASSRGTKIIIRIMPSPGNFTGEHRLSLTPEPVNGDRCDISTNRSYDDIGDEMLAIHNYNTANGIMEFGFEPANEPQFAI